MADNTASLVVALSAQLTKFENDMKKAGIMAGQAVDDIEKKFAGINPQMSGSFLGNLFSNIVTKGIEAATKALTDFYDRFIALQGTAKLTALSLEQVWGFQEAAKASGASIDNAAKSLEKMTFLVDQMNRGGENTLTKLLDANPEAMRGLNKETITLSQTLQVVANITRDFNEQVRKVSAVRLAGMTDDLVPALEKGGAALQKLIDTKASGAPPLTQMVEQAKQFDAYMQSASQWIKADLAQGLQNTLREFEAIKSFFSWLKTASVNSWGPGGAAGAGAGAGGGAPPTRVVMNMTPKGSGKSKLPAEATNETTTALDRQTDQIEKHILVTQASTAAVGLNVGEQERLKTEALLVAAAEKDGVTATGAYAEALKLLAVRAGEAAMANAQAQYKMAQLHSANQILGSAISTAFADAIVEGKKLNEVLDSLLKTLAKAAINSTIMSLFTPGAGGGLSPFSKMLGFAGGTNSAPGGLAMVGERGPELVNLPRGAQVIPNDVLRANMSGGTAVSNQFYVSGDVSQSTIDRLAQAVTAANKKADGLMKMVTQTQRLQATGVG